MQAFARIDELEPVLQESGFVDIRIDLSDSLMEVPEPEQEAEENEGGDDGNEKKKVPQMQSTAKEGSRFIMERDVSASVTWRILI
jgi:hypothetical protein